MLKEDMKKVCERGRMGWTVMGKGREYNMVSEA